MHSRRYFLDRILRNGAGSAAATALLKSGLACAQPAKPAFAPVTPGYQLRFPQDHGSHPQFRTEWWYITAWLSLPDATALGLQITFFRTATGYTDSTTSRFAPRQLQFAHLALADAKTKTLFHDQQAARSALTSYAARGDDTDVQMRQWRLQRGGDDSYTAKAKSIYLPQEQAIAIDCRFTPNSAPLLQGSNGYSRKGPHSEQASYYYSRPQMAVSGQIALGKRQVPVKGIAWLDHEWSTSLLDDRAGGWDWIGINLHNGGSLMAFQLRDKQSGDQAANRVWSYVVLRDASGAVLHAASALDAAIFVPLRRWQSALSNTGYPVAQHVRCGEFEYDLEPLFDNQEIDARASTGGFYWEGAVRVFAANEKTAALSPASKAPATSEIGLGYLEMTGYAAPVKLAI